MLNVNQPNASDQKFKKKKKFKNYLQSNDTCPKIFGQVAD